MRKVASVIQEYMCENNVTSDIEAVAVSRVVELRVAHLLEVRHFKIFGIKV
jgi:hypothetical protein